MKKPGLFPVRILMLGFVDGGPNLQNNVSFLFENTIPFSKIHPTAPNILRVGKKFYPPYHIRSGNFAHPTILLIRQGIILTKKSP